MVVATEGIENHKVADAVEDPIGVKSDDQTVHMVKEILPVILQGDSQDRNGGVQGAVEIFQGLFGRNDGEDDLVLVRGVLASIHFQSSIQRGVDRVNKV
jgi:hypothetical protein